MTKQGLLLRWRETTIILALFVLSAGAGEAGGSRANGSINNVTTEMANKRVVLAFYEAGLNHKDYPAASRYLGRRYIQHNPAASDGRAGFARFIAYLRARYPNAHSRVERVFTDGDFVILHVHERLRPGDDGNAIVDIFRLKAGRIVEHWDVKQPVPAKAANPNTMF